MKITINDLKQQAERITQHLFEINQECKRLNGSVVKIPDLPIYPRKNFVGRKGTLSNVWFNPVNGCIQATVSIRLLDGSGQTAHYSQDDFFFHITEDWFAS